MIVKFKLFENNQNIIINDDGTGLMISNTILGECNWNDAKKLCKKYNEGGYNDWRLPTKDELNIMYLNKDIIGGFVAGTYWSSSEYSATNAWKQYFYNGNQINYNKYYSFYVRAVRGLNNLDVNVIKYNL